MSLRSRIHALKEQLGAEAKKSLGQNFLVSEIVVERIIDQVMELKPDVLIEVGPGLGSLTEELILKKHRPLLIEMDRGFAHYWRGRGLEVIEADALTIDWCTLAGTSGRRVLVSNLPYQISSRIVIDRCMDEVPLTGMVLMFQKEVAQRIRARVQDEAYGFLSVVAQSFWDIETVCDAGPRDFDPPPKVASRVLVFREGTSRLKSSGYEVIQRKAYLKFLKAAFLSPRKLMFNNLKTLGDLEETQLLHWLTVHGHSRQVRAEELSVKEFLSLAQYLGYL